MALVFPSSEASVASSLDVPVIHEDRSRCDIHVIALECDDDFGWPAASVVLELWLEGRALNRTDADEFNDPSLGEKDIRTVFSLSINTTQDKKILQTVGCRSRNRSTTVWSLLSAPVCR